MKILIINGPNLNLLGEREPGVYGTCNLQQLNDKIFEKSKSLNMHCDFFQSNHEGEIIDKLHDARLNYDGVIINAGAFTHYSYAIRDAISAIKIPCIEVHISNVFAREKFRENSVISAVCKGSISGFGEYSYILAVEGLKNIIINK